MSGIAALAVALLLLGGAGPVSAASERVTVQLGPDLQAHAAAAPVADEGVLLQITLPNGQMQEFPGLGEALVPLSGKAGEPGLVARDLLGDGRDQIILRGSVQPDRGAMLVFRFEPAFGEFVPVEFTDDRFRTNPFVVVHASEPVLIDAAGTIEAHFETERPDGRKSHHVARYHWNGKGYSHSADN